MDFKLNLTTETIQHLTIAEPICVEPETSLREVFQLLKKANRGCALICRGDVLVGIFTERDAIRLMAKGTSFDVPIEAVMVPDPVSVKATDAVGEAITKMSVGGYRRLPVVDDDGRPLGVLKVSGILHYLVEHFPKVIYTLPPKPHHITHEREGA